MVETLLSQQKKDKDIYPTVYNVKDNASSQEFRWRKKNNYIPWITLKQEKMFYGRIGLCKNIFIVF